MIWKNKTKIIPIPLKSGEYYENYLQKVKNNLPLDKNEIGVIYCPLKESGFKYIYKYTLIQIIKSMNDYGKKQFDLSKNKDQVRSSKEGIFKKIEESILHHDFQNALNLCNHLENSVNWIPEIVCIREIAGIVLFYQDYYSNNNDFSFSKELEAHFEEIAELYRKKKDYCRQCECLLKVCIYNSYFIGNELKCEKYIQKILLLLQLTWFYKQRNNNIRKQNLMNYLGITACQKNNEEIKNNINIFVNFLLNHFPIYNIYNKKISNLEIFKSVHRKIIKKGWKNVLLQMKETNKDGNDILKEITKKKIDKGSQLFIDNYNKDLNTYNYNLIWFNNKSC